jgi:hypothetical protein
VCSGWVGSEGVWVKAAGALPSLKMGLSSYFLRQDGALSLLSRTQTAVRHGSGQKPSLWGGHFSVYSFCVVIFFDRLY